MSLPKVIHYCWFGPNAIPEKELMCIESWTRYLPEYEIMFWNENSFDVKQNLFASQAYDTGHYAFVSDYVRAKVLFEYGGVYLDSDVEIFSKFPAFLEKSDNFLGFETKAKLGTAIMGFVPKHNVISEFIKVYDDKFIDDNGNLNTIANVSYLTDILKKSGLNLDGSNQIVQDITVYAREYFYPKKLSDTEFKIVDQTLAVHKCSNSWMTDREKNRGNNKFWIEVVRPSLRFLRKVGVSVIGSKNIKTYEIKIRNMLK
jgi:mannosyltransferase OCH1-like enzyme